MTGNDGRTYASGATYHANGSLAQFTYSNGIVHTMTQNARQFPLQVRSGTVTGYEYWYDANGNPTHLHDLVQGGDYSRGNAYDALDRLTASAAASYGGDHWHRFTYDAIDNLKSWKLGGVKDHADYAYDANHRLTSITNTSGAPVVSLSYDAQGNLSTKDGQAYSFDYGNRLRTVQGKETYRYDALGRRVQSTAASGASTTVWLYSQTGQLMYSSDWQGANYQNHKTREYIHLAGSQIATVDHHWPSNAVIAVKYQHTDALGSPVAVTNEAGQVIERTQWEPYGAAIGKPSYSGVGYTGHVMDGATGLTYMQQRYYDPSIGRFLSVDPVTASSSTGVNFNRYWYANNNPYRFSDPDGRCARVTGSMICGGAAGIAALATTGRIVPSSGRAEKKKLEGVPEKISKDDKEAVSNINDGIESARKRVGSADDAVMNGAWNETTWLWNPDHPEFKKETIKVAAFVNPASPSRINVGRYFGQFANSEQKFTYHNAVFSGGPGALTFAALHEFGHVLTAGIGQPGSEREMLANAFAYNRIHFSERKNFRCNTCTD